MKNMALVADIGGTNARFALATQEGEKILLHHIQHFPVAEFETIIEATKAYLVSSGETPKKACFAVAAYNVGNNYDLTNSHWNFNADAFQTSLGLAQFNVVNDFYALANGMSIQGSDSFKTVHAGVPDREAPMLVIGPGTGLGQALIVPAQSGEHIISTQGGHVAFSPYTEKEQAVSNFIAEREPRICAEKLLSGQGLVNIYQGISAITDKPATFLRASEITNAAILGDDHLAVEAVAMFCEILGDVVGDAVLATGARGGVYLGGGILPKIQDFFLASKFVDRFVAKGNMKSYLEIVPIQMNMRDDTALYGAAKTLNLVSSP